MLNGQTFVGVSRTGERRLLCADPASAVNLGLRRHGDLVEFASRLPGRARIAGGARMAHVQHECVTAKLIVGAAFLVSAIVARPRAWRCWFLGLDGIAQHIRRHEFSLQSRATKNGGLSSPPERSHHRVEELHPSLGTMAATASFFHARQWTRETVVLRKDLIHWSICPWRQN
jgi:hypothetical protein